MNRAMGAALSVAEEKLWLVVDMLTSDTRVAFFLFSAVVGVASLVERPGEYRVWGPLFIAAIALGRTIANGKRLTLWGRAAALVSVICYSWLAITGYLAGDFHAVTVYWTFSVFLIAEVATRRRRISVRKGGGEIDDDRDRASAAVAHSGGRGGWRFGAFQATDYRRSD